MRFPKSEDPGAKARLDLLRALPKRLGRGFSTHVAEEIAKNKDVSAAPPRLAQKAAQMRSEEGPAAQEPQGAFDRIEMLPPERGPRTKSSPAKPRARMKGRGQAGRYVAASIFGACTIAALGAAVVVIHKSAVAPVGVQSQILKKWGAASADWRAQEASQEAEDAMRIHALVEGLPGNFTTLELLGPVGPETRTLSAQARFMLDDGACAQSLAEFTFHPEAALGLRATVVSVSTPRPCLVMHDERTIVEAPQHEGAFGPHHGIETASIMGPSIAAVEKASAAYLDEVALRALLHDRPRSCVNPSDGGGCAETIEYDMKSHVYTRISPVLESDGSLVPDAQMEVNAAYRMSGDTLCHESIGASVLALGAGLDDARAEAMEQTAEARLRSVPGGEVCFKLRKDAEDVNRFYADAFVLGEPAPYYTDKRPFEQRPL